MIRTFETDPARLFFTFRCAVEQAQYLAQRDGVRQRVLILDRHPLTFRFQISPVESA